MSIDAAGILVTAVRPTLDRANPWPVSGRLNHPVFIELRKNFTRLTGRALKKKCQTEISMTKNTRTLILEFFERFQAGQMQITHELREVKTHLSQLEIGVAGMRDDLAQLAGNPHFGWKAKSLLNQKLAAFDPQKHGGEVMADVPRGEEAFAVQPLP